MKFFIASNLLADFPLASIIIVAVGLAAVIAAIICHCILSHRNKRNNTVEESVGESDREPAQEPVQDFAREPAGEPVEEAAADEEPAASQPEQLWEEHPEPEEQPVETVEEVIWINESNEEPVEEAAEPVEEKAEEQPTEVVIVEEVFAPVQEEPVKEEPVQEQPVAAQTEPAAEEPAEEETEEEIWETDPELLYDESEEYFDEPESEEERAEEAAEEKEEAPATVRVAEGEGDNVHYVIKKYQKGFMAKLIQSEDIVKKYYTEIKNELLSYEGIKSRETWNHESFAAGRNVLAKINLRGKTLALYLALDPKQVLAEGRYAIDDLSNVGVHASTPTLYRIKNNRRLGGSKQLIKAAMKGHEQNVKYKPINWMRRLPYEDNDALAEKGLIKVTVEEEK